MTDRLTQSFEDNRAHLRGVAYRMLGSPAEADDAVQEAWLRFSRSDTSEIANLRGWLTTVAARICLDMLRSRKSRAEETLEAAESHVQPSDDVLLADSAGLALLVVLDRLTPAERVAFVLHDMFDLPFDEIAPVVGRTAEATRQLASRARRRVQGASLPDVGAPTLSRKREVVDAFLAAARGGDFEALLAVLDPDVVVRADGAAVRLGAAAEVRGAAAVARTFEGRAAAARPALIDGVPGLVWMVGGKARVVFDFTIAGDRIAGIELIAKPERLSRLNLTA